MTVHHVVEHGLDFLIAVTLLYAVYRGGVAETRWVLCRQRFVNLLLLERAVDDPGKPIEDPVSSCG